MGRVVDSNSDGIADLLVTARSESLSGQIWKTKTRKDGWFKMQSLPPSEFELKLLVGSAQSSLGKSYWLTGFCRERLLKNHGDRKEVQTRLIEMTLEAADPDHRSKEQRAKLWNELYNASPFDQTKAMAWSYLEDWLNASKQIWKDHLDPEWAKDRVKLVFKRIRSLVKTLESTSVEN
jgi:hypothetical protein